MIAILGKLNYELRMRARSRPLILIDSSVFSMRAATWNPVVESESSQPAGKATEIEPIMRDIHNDLHVGMLISMVLQPRSYYLLLSLAQPIESPFLQLRLATNVAGRSI